MAAIIYLEKQNNEELLQVAVDTVVELIEDEHPEQLRMFTVWLNRMFHEALNDEETGKIKQLTEVKSMLAQVVEQIEARGEARGMQQNARENAIKMKSREYPIKDIADITGLTEEEIKKL